MKAGVLGVGKLGGTIAYALAQEAFLDELVLYDVVENLAWAQAQDIRTGLGGRTPTAVRAGALEDLRDSDAVLIVAGQGRKPGMTRLDLLHTNAGLVADVSRKVAAIAPNSALVILTNPMDVMTTVAWEASGFPRDRVVGSGQLLDSARLQCLLADHFGVPLADVEATVLGEHGDRAVPLFSRATVRGRPVELSAMERTEILEQLKGLSAKMIEIKGGTTYGPGGATAALVRALLGKTRTVLPASVVLDGEYGLWDVAMGVPAILGEGRVLGVERWPLPADEEAALLMAGHDLAKFAEDATVLLGLAVRHTSLEHIAAQGR